MQYFASTTDIYLYIYDTCSYYFLLLRSVYKNSYTNGLIYVFNIIILILLVCVFVLSIYIPFCSQR